MITITQAESIYQNSGNLKINYHRIASEKLKNFCFSLKKIEYYLKQTFEEIDDLFQDFLEPLKVYRYYLCSHSLKLNAQRFFTTENIDLLNQQLGKIEKIYPEHYPNFQHIYEDFIDLSKNNENPLLDYIIYQIFIDDFQPINLVIKNRQFIPNIQESITNLNLGIDEQNISLLLPSDLKTGQEYKKLVVIGCSRWFPDYIFSAPRTKTIDIVHYDWFYDQWKYEPVFVGSKNCYFPHTVETPTLSVNINHKISEKLAPEEVLLPRIDLSKIAKKYINLNSNVEEIEAYLFDLEGDTGVFLAEDSKPFVIDLSQEENLISKKPVSQIETDMFILLRTQGGGDYVTETADQILNESGQDSQMLRKLQQEWKFYLKKMIDRYSMHHVCSYLRHKGCQLANNKMNVHNFISERYIKPDNANDFKIILDVIGLGERFDEFYNSACLINNAHIQAGLYLMTILRNKIPDYDLTKLEQTGIMEFKLENNNSGSLTAFRVLDKSKETFSVPASQHGKIFDI